MAVTLGPEAADEFALYYDEAAAFADLTFDASVESHEVVSGMFSGAEM